MPTASCVGSSFPTLDRHSRAGRELLAPQSERLKLPRTFSFAPVEEKSEEVCLCAAADQLFSAHTTCMLPCGFAHEAARESGVGACMHDRVHCFILREALAGPLNARLGKLATELENAAMSFGMNDNARLSNWGGFQSTDDLFKSGDTASIELHRIISAAVDELANESAEPPPLADLHAGFAWINVNRQTDDKNLCHIHCPGRLSAVYFVSSGDFDAQVAAAGDLSSHLILRGGPKSAPSDAMQTYLPIPPTPGTLWLFAGSVPHCVMPSDADAPSLPRVSVAVNLQAAAPPPLVPPAPTAT